MRLAWISAALLLAATAGAAPLATILDGAMTAYEARDFGRARRSFLILADQGSAIAETMLGVIYARGQGVAADPATAAAFWLRAGSRGYPPAQLAFARALATGAGVTRNPGEAWVWASLAARGSDAGVAHEATAMAVQLQRGFSPEQAARLAKQLAGWRPWMAG